MVTGVVNLYGPNNEFAAAGINPDGTYTVTDAPVGLVKVAVVSEKPASQGANNNRAVKNHPNAPPPPPPPPDASGWFAIDAKYADPATSGKEMTLSGGNNTQNIVLE
ncbi:MAG: hypothetical protein ACJ8C4_17125 [Gemmataceae bacterium]